jgi:hypothetical protein
MPTFVHGRIALVASLSLLGAFSLACTGTSTEAQNCDGSPSVETMSLQSDKKGYVAIPVDVDGSDASFQVITEKSGGYVATEQIVDPEGEVVIDWEDWANSKESLTEAFYATEDATVINWPVRADDPEIYEGAWTVYASTLDKNLYYDGNQAVDVTVIRRSCVGNTAKLHATIVFAGGLGDDDVVRPAVETAAARWQEIYAEVGIKLDYDFAETDMKASLPEPAVGAAAYTELYDALGGEGLVLVVGDDVDGMADLYGEAGGIPGPMVATPHSVVAVGWLVHAGANATFNDDEIEILAETMAHESGHFLGLFHPVEIGWNYWDALDDTEKCQSGKSCENDLADNLMFPYPVCSGASCTVQDVITNEQSGVVRNNAGVL